MNCKVGVIDAPDFAALKAAASRFDLTPSAVLLAAYAEVLRRYCGHTRFALNLTVMDRPILRGETATNLVGNFISVLPLAVHCRPADGFVERARTIQQHLWMGLDHRLMSGMDVMREYARGREMPGAAILPIVFTSTLGLATSSSRAGREQMAVSTASAGLAFSVMQTPQVWLNLAVGESEGTLQHAWTHVDGLFPDGMIAAMSDEFSRRVLALAREPSKWEHPEPLFGQSSMQLPASAAPPPAQERCPRLEELFLAQVAINASRAAVITPDSVITYADLELHSRRIAARLREEAATTPMIVAVAMERGWEQLAAVLGVLRAGAAYVPIDASLPTERVHYLLAATGATIALTQTAVDSAMTWPLAMKRIVVDSNQAGDVARIDTRADATANALAYIIFTSGSSGSPKGVMIEHAAAVNTILTINRMIAAAADDRIFNIASLSFDLSVYDIFGMLAVGGAIVIPRSSPHPEPDHWAEMIVGHGVTLWESVPAHLDLLLESAALHGQSTALRLAMLSGDWIPLSLPARLRAVFGRSTQVLAMGGATEAAIWSIYKWVDEVDPQWSSIPYGRALTGQQVHVLDEDLQQCPAWTTGEIYIGGAGVAVGYWRDDKQTAERFLLDPRTGERLYRTGDLGRYLPDGEIELLGRLDTQVKVSGYRLDLGEIEFALSRCDGVSQAAVVARRSQDRTTLAAYVVLDAGADLGEDDLHAQLKARISAYAIPARITILDSLPLNANGKLDRRALADLAPMQTTGYRAPATEMEKTLVSIYEQVLGVGPIGVGDNFFRIGGDSVLATQVIARIRRELGVELPIRDLFQTPAVEGLAAQIVGDTLKLADAAILNELIETIKSTSDHGSAAEVLS